MSISRIRSVIVIFGCAIVLASCEYPFEWAYYTASGGQSKLGEIPTSPKAEGVCPDKPEQNLYEMDKDKGWTPTPCETAILSAAIHECVSKTSWSQSVEPWILTAGGAAAAVSGLLTKNDTAAVAGAATLAAGALGGSAGISSVFAGTAHAPIPSMVSAAETYAKIYRNIKPVENRIFYAGLWNAAGSACPEHLFGSFEMAHFFVTDVDNFDINDKYDTRLNDPKNFQPKPSLTSFTVTFASGKDQLVLDYDNQANLNDAVKQYQKNLLHSALTVKVVGGATENELILRNEISEKRAQSVEKYLKGKGVDPARIIVRGESGIPNKSQVVISIEP